MDLSPENFLKFPIPTKPLTTTSFQNRELAPTTFTIFQRLPPFPEGVRNVLMRAIKSRKYHPFKVEAISAAASIEVKYLQPVMEIANRDFFHPRACSLRVACDTDNDGSYRAMTLTLDAPEYRDMNFDGTVFDGIADVDGASERLATGQVAGVAIFVEPNTIHWDDFFHGDRPVVVETDEFTHGLVFNLVERCREAECDFGLLTDEHMCAILDCGPDNPRRPDRITLEVHSTTALTIRTILAFFVYERALDEGLCTLPLHQALIPCRGASNNPPWTGNLNETQVCFRDFDLYTLQRSQDAWNDFCRWKEDVMEDGEPLLSGDILQVDTDGFVRALNPLRSRRPVFHLQPEVMDSIVKNQRPRHDDVDALLASGRRLSFIVTEPKRSGADYFSQVFFGRLVDDPVGGARVTCSQSVCLKLFDERWFPMPDEPDFSCPPEQLLLDLNFADDMVRREEAVYDKLRHLQGSLVPHCYGFHVFTGPDGWKSFGFFMEIIDGLSLYDYPVSDFSPDEQAIFVQRLRMSFRAIKFAGIEQGDCHLDQVMCVSSSDSPAHCPDFVFIDFAFAPQRFGETTNAYPPRDIRRLHASLYLYMPFDEDLIDRNWADTVEEEE